ncbi:cytochrome P450 [Smaragdicoccus niigatensis]|uniref:cytochrome P450 n=2 Tax=Smaragdicoccus niigatensis TaxID=359359 RepID=UPI00039DDDCA|nr:cytochrome P450 [Smaragdicoccus niigatensis]
MSVETKLPPGPNLPTFVQGIAFLGARPRSLQFLQDRYGSEFTLHIPVFGQTVVLSDPALIKQLFQTSPAVAGNIKPNLGRVVGKGSMFNLEGEAHRQQRKLLTPPFHGKRMHNYEAVIEEEFRRESATWPVGREFDSIGPMTRITLNAILRAVFGAEGAEFEELRKLLPPWVALASRLAALPEPPVDLGPWSPWGRFKKARRAYEGIIDRLVEKALADPNLSEREDILALMLQSRYDNGEPMARSDIADELAALLAAGHETTASTLAWAVERLRRHPALLERLVEEANEGGSELRQATIWEVQRTRTVIDFAGRNVLAPSLTLGEWTIPHGTNIICAIRLAQSNPEYFPDPHRFDPDRFLTGKANTAALIPFGGGTRRCIGAAFASMEMDVVLRNLLRDFDVATTTAPSERSHFRGVAYSPADGGKLKVSRKTAVTRPTMWTESQGSRQTAH